MSASPCWTEIRGWLSAFLATDLMTQIDDAIEAHVQCRLAQAGQAVSAPAPFEGTPPSRMLVFPFERTELLRQEWPKGTPPHELLEAINALPGKHPVTIRDVGAQACKLGLKRPPGFGTSRRDARRPVSAFSAERDDVIRREYPAGTLMPVLHKLVEALPGPSVTLERVRWRAKELRLMRPPRFMSDLMSGNAHWRKSAAEAPPAAAPAPPSALPPPEPAIGVQPPKIAAYVRPERKVDVPPLKTSAQLARERTEAQIAAHIAARGVTRCPTAMVEVTSAKIPEADRVAIAAHDAALEARRLEDHHRRTPTGRVLLAKQAARQRGA